MIGTKIFTRRGKALPDPKTGSLGETTLPREDYSLSTESIRTMVALPLDWIDWLSAMVPTYDSIVDAEGALDQTKLHEIRGMRKAVRLLRDAYEAQHPNARK